MVTATDATASKNRQQLAGVYRCAGSAASPVPRNISPLYTTVRDSLMSHGHRYPSWYRNPAETERTLPRPSSPQSLPYSRRSLITRPESRPKPHLQYERDGADSPTLGLWQQLKAGGVAGTGLEAGEDDDHGSVLLRPQVLGLQPLAQRRMLTQYIDSDSDSHPANSNPPSPARAASDGATDDDDDQEVEMELEKPEALHRPPGARNTIAQASPCPLPELLQNVLEVMNSITQRQCLVAQESQALQGLVELVRILQEEADWLLEFSDLVDEYVDVVNEEDTATSMTKTKTTTTSRWASEYPADTREPMPDGAEDENEDENVDGANLDSFMDGWILDLESRVDSGVNLEVAGPARGELGIPARSRIPAESPDLPGRKKSESKALEPVFRDSGLGLMSPDLPRARKRQGSLF